jgi:peptidoglycan hydrolase-like protein with peptidoglycan-binding domain
MIARKASLFLFLALVFQTLSMGQHQRLGLAPQTIFLQNGTSTVEAFCLDKQLYATRSFAPYPKVLNDVSTAFAITNAGRKIPLQEAIDRRLVVVEGSGLPSTQSGLALRFSSPSKSINRIVFESATALGELTGGLIDSRSPILRELGTNVANETSRQKNDRIWRAQAGERILQELGFYGQNPVTPANTENALKKFQTAAGLPSSGFLDSETSKRLTDEHDQWMVRLRKVGFQASNERSKVEAMSDPLRQFQSYRGLEVTGHLTREAANLIKSDAVIAGEVSALHNSGATSALNVKLDDFPNLFTFFRQKNNVIVLMNNNGAPELWLFNGTKFFRAGFGDTAVTRFENAFQNTVDKASSNNAIVVSTTELTDTELAELATRKADQKPASVFIAVSPLQQGRSIPGAVPIPQATRISRVLQRHFGANTPIYIGHDLALGLENSKHLPALIGPQRLRFFVDAKRINDRGVITSLSERIGELNIDIVEAQEGGPGEPGIGIVVGNNDGNMRATVMDLARQGSFRDGILALAKCGHPDDTEFNSSLIRAANARAVIFYDEQIQPQAVKQVLVALIDRLRNSGARQGDWMSLFRMSVDDAASNARGVLREQILKLKHAHIQTSRAWTPREPMEVLA